MRFICIGLSASALFAAAPAHSASAFPAAPLRLVLPVTTGGATDFVARIIQPSLTAELGQQVIIDNRGGGGGRIATEIVANATPNGYTLLFGNVGAIAINPALFRDFKLDTVNSFTCLNVVADSVAALVANGKLPARTLKEFVALAKASPGKFNYGAASAASPARLGMEVFSQLAGIKLVGIYYKGAGDVTTSLLTGDLAVASVSLAPVMTFIKSGQLRPLAIRSAKRTDMLPDLPTFRELGYPELTNSSWQALYAPAKTPMPITRRLHAAIHKVLLDPKIDEMMRPGGASVINSASIEECNAFTRSQVEFWGKTVAAVGLAGAM